MITQASGKSRWDSIDCLKGISCIAVVLIHYNTAFDGVPAWVTDSMNAMCRFAVPVFLCISGFFAQPRGTADYHAKKIRDTLKMLLWTAAVYAVFALCWYPLMQPDWDVGSFIRETITATKVSKFFLTCDPFLYAHLWYLIALIWCYAAVLVFPWVTRRKGILALVLLLLYAGMQEFEILPCSIALGEMSSRVYVYNMFLFRALPFFLFGMLMRGEIETLRAIRLGKLPLAAIALAGCLCAALERRSFGISQFYVGSYVTTFAMFLCAVQHPDVSNIYIYILRHIGRDLSMNVYLFHIAVGKTMDLLGKYCGFWGKSWWTPVRLLLVLALSLLLAEVLFILRRSGGRREKGSATPGGDDHEKRYRL